MQESSYLVLHLSWFHVTNASSASMMLTIFGGKIEDLRVFLIEERLADGWVSWNASRFGVTLAAFNNTALGVAIKTKNVTPKKSSPA